MLSKRREDAPRQSESLTRREAVLRLGLLGISVATATSVVSACGNDQAARNQWWNRILLPPSEIPEITAATSSRIDDGFAIRPTADYDTDPYFRYDGCHALSSDSAGIFATPPETVVPEIITDAEDVEVVFRSGRTGSGAVGIRVIVDGKLSHLRMLRMDAEKGVDYFYLHRFNEKRPRHLKFEVDGANRFNQAIVGEHTILERPAGAHQFRHTAIGDSIQRGGPDLHDGAEVFGDYFYMPWESHSRFQAALMNCDSYINLGVGGTGWSGPTYEDSFAARIPMALSGSPHVLGFYGSRNDSGKEEHILAAVQSALSQVKTVPSVLVSGPQQAGYSALDDRVRQGVGNAGRMWLNLGGVAAAPDSNPTRHPTFEEQLKLARSAYDQTDLPKVVAAAQAANAAGTAATVVLRTRPASPLAVGSDATLIATVSPRPSAAVKIQFFDNNIPVGPAVSLSDGTASTYVANMAEGEHQLTAKLFPGAPQAGETPTSQPVQLLVLADLGVDDSFDRPNGEVGRSPDGKKWNTVSYSGWVISDNALANPTAERQVFCDIDAGARFGIYEFIPGGVYHADLRFCLLYGDGTNHVFFNTNGGADNWRFFARNNNVSLPLATGVIGGGWTAGDRIRVEVSPGSNDTRANFVLSKNDQRILSAKEVELGTLIEGTRLAVGVNELSRVATLKGVRMTPAG